METRLFPQDQRYVGWNHRYQETFRGKNSLINLWYALPNYINLQIWLSMNKEIFEGKSVCINKISTTEKALWVDTLSIIGIKSIKNGPLKVEERYWMVEILWNLSPRINPSKKSGLPCWQIRMSMEELQN